MSCQIFLFFTHSTYRTHPRAQSSYAQHQRMGPQWFGGEGYRLFNQQSICEYLPFSVGSTEHIDTRWQAIGWYGAGRRAAAYYSLAEQELASNAIDGYAGNAASGDADSCFGAGRLGDYAQTTAWRLGRNSDYEWCKIFIDTAAVAQGAASIRIESRADDGSDFVCARIGVAVDGA